MNGAKVPTSDKDVSSSVAPAAIHNQGSNLAASSKYTQSFGVSNLKVSEDNLTLLITIK